MDWDEETTRLYEFCTLSGGKYSRDDTKERCEFPKAIFELYHDMDFMDVTFFPGIISEISLQIPDNCDVRRKGDRVFMDCDVERYHARVIYYPSGYIRIEGNASVDLYLGVK